MTTTTFNNISRMFDNHDKDKLQTRVLNKKERQPTQTASDPESLNNLT